jgi:hypothetical protein
MVLINEPKDRIGGLPAGSQGDCEMRIFILIATVLALALAACGRPAEQERGRPTAILVSPIHEAQVVRGDDGKDHVEYELLVVNAVEQPVTLTSLTVLDPAAKELTRIDGPVLVAATQTLLDKKPVAEIPASAAVSVDVDLIVPPGTAPERVTHRLAYSVPGGTSTAVFVDPPVIDGPEVAINRRPATVIKPPSRGMVGSPPPRAAHPTSIGIFESSSTVAASRPPRRSLSTGPSSRATGSMRGTAPRTSSSTSMEQMCSRSPMGPSSRSRTASRTRPRTR